MKMRTNEFEIDDDDEDFDDETEYVEVECPQCHDLAYFEEDLLDDDDMLKSPAPIVMKLCLNQ